MLCRMYLPLVLAVVSLPLAAQVQTSSSQPDPTVRSTSLEEGRLFYEQGRFEEALVLFQQAMRQHKKSASTHYWLGMTWFALGDNDNALKAFRRATQLDKKWAPGHVGMGMVYMSLPNRRLDARKAYRKAVEVDPENADLQYRMGLTYMDQEQSGRLIGSDRDGRKYFLKAVDLNPSHADAFFQLGRCYDSPDELEPEKAISAYIRQFRVNPDHSEALLRFANASHRTERYDLGVVELSALIGEWGDNAPDRIRTMLSQFEVLALGSDGQYDQLQEALESYISQLDPDEQEVYRDLSHVAPPEELAAWEAATGPERDAFWQAFWNERDANPTTIENERLVEHYRRVMYARIHFSEKQYPYDRRGEIYVRYGEPDDRRHFVYTSHSDPYTTFQISENPAVDAIREQNLQFGYQLQVGRGDVQSLTPGDIAKRHSFGVESIPAEEIPKPDILHVTHVEVVGIKAKRIMGDAYAVESWVYVPHGLELFFVDQMGGGRFDYPLPTLVTDMVVVGKSATDLTRRQEQFHPKQRASELIARSPEVYEHDFGGELLEYAFDAVSFRGDGGATEVDLSYSIPAWQFGDITDKKGDRTWLDNQVTLRDSLQAPAFSRKFRFGPIARPERQVANQEFQGAAFTLAANPTTPSGTFTAAVELRDEATKRIGIYKKPVSFSDYRGDDLLISDLKLSTGITPATNPGPFVRGGLNVVPNPGRLYSRGQLVYVYYEVYNLDMDEDRTTSYETLYEITPMGMPTLRNRRARRPVDMQTVMSFFEGEGRSAEEAEYTAMDTTDLEAGEYVLTVTLTDRHADQRVSKSVNFMVVGP